MSEVRTQMPRSALNSAQQPDIFRTFLRPGATARGDGSEEWKFATCR